MHSKDEEISKSKIGKLNVDYTRVFGGAWLSGQGLAFE